MVFKVAGMINKHLDKEKAKEDFKGKFSELIINLREEIEHLKQFDFKDAAYQFLVVTNWLKDPVELIGPVEEILSKLRWYDVGGFQFTVLPLITKSINYNICLRILTKSSSLTGSVKFSIHSKGSTEMFIPNLYNKGKNSYIHVAPNRILMYDITIDSSDSDYKNYLTVVLTLEPVALSTRIKILTEGKAKGPKEYDDLKALRFYDIVDLPYVTPFGARYIILNNKTIHSFRRIKQKNLEKLKLHNLEETDPEWIADYNSLSEFWG